MSEQIETQAERLAPALAWSIARVYGTAIDFVRAETLRLAAGGPVLENTRREFDALVNAIAEVPDPVHALLTEPPR